MFTEAVSIKNNGLDGQRLVDCCFGSSVVVQQKEERLQKDCQRPRWVTTAEMLGKPNGRISSEQITNRF